jgi:hypothetical protein
MVASQFYRSERTVVCVLKDDLNRQIVVIIRCCRECSVSYCESEVGAFDARKGSAFMVAEETHFDLDAVGVVAAVSISLLTPSLSTLQVRRWRPASSQE